MKNFKNEERQIGVELEFYGLKPKDAANLLNEKINGKVEHRNSALSVIKADDGEYKLETDAKLIQKLAESSKKNKLEDKIDYDGALKDILSVISDELVPTELVTPPIKIKDLKKINQLQEILVANGASGTTQSFRFAFAAQLNPEAESLEPDYILKVLKSFIMLTDWIKEQTFMDLTRKLTSYAGDFPKDYVLKIFNENYNPDIDSFISDYLKFNPTRNRGLDLLPLLAFINEEKVMSKVQDERVNKRPTFHYRLPNSQLNLKSWTIEVEWSRWKLVENITKDEKLFNKMCEHFYDIQRGSSDLKPSDWLREANNYVETFRS